MATSQFTIYSSSDPYGPGLLTGLTGSLLPILDACLVNGYGTGQYTKQAAGWTKPLPNVSGSLGCWKQASGSQMTLFINDAAPNAAANAREAWACGYEMITSLTGPVGGGSIFTGSYGNGAGYGQFPLPSQLLTSGHVVCRKSSTADSVGRSWVIMADAYTMYMWIRCGDNNVLFYIHWAFGDIYSLYGSADRWKCFIYGQSAENAVNSTTNDWSDSISMGRQRDTANALTVGMGGHYIARTPSGTGGSQQFTRKGDCGIAESPSTATPYSMGINGILQTPSGGDNSYYMNPLWLVNPSEPALRGKFRGMYQLAHPISNFSDGQLIQGSGDYAGRTFIVIRQSNHGSMWAMEVSATVDTN